MDRQTAIGTVSIGRMHQEGGFVFDRDYYFDPEHRWRQDLEIARWCEETYAPYPIYNAEAHLINLDDQPNPFRQIGGLQPNLILAAALGAELVFYGHQDPDVSGQPLKGIDSLVALRSFEGLDWATLEPIATFLRQMDAFKEEYAGTGIDIFPPFFWDRSGRATIHGLLTTAHKLMGEEFFLLPLTDPELARAVLDWIADAYLDLIRLFADRAGHSITSLHVGECSGCMFSSEQWDLAIPATNRIVDACGTCRIHSCGKSDHLLEQMAKVHNLSNFNIGSGTSVARSRKIVGTGRQLDVIPDPAMLHGGTTSDVRAFMKQVLAENEEGPLEIQFHMEPGMPWENALAIFETMRAHGVVPEYTSLVERWGHA
ncbi:MAG: uroporphyrinogen decarboxylase family protein [Pirellulales bacterium]